MELLIWAAFLTLFLLWCHRFLVNTHQSRTLASSSTPHDGATLSPALESSAKNAPAPFSIVKLMALFIGCCAFIALMSGIQHKLHEQPSESIQMQENSSDEAASQSQEEAFRKINESNNLQNSTQDKASFIEILPAGTLHTKFKDVAGLYEAKEEVQDFISFLKDPAGFQRLGAKPPKGLLMAGPPGVGKTYLARAMAGEANVTFIAVSGSQFDEEYVGVGAARVRRLFKLAREHAPCILFIDEIDSVAARREDHHNPAGAQTVNQLLTEMDGLNDIQNEGIIVIAASNRMDALDPAILRPGRLDRQLQLELPTQKERKEILSVHLEKVTFAKELSVANLAKISTGFSSADLANWVNEAAIHATKTNKHSVDQNSFDVAKDRLILGSLHSALIMTEKEKMITAYHEAGHALVGYLLPNHDPIYKVTIAPRGPSLGHTHYQPEKDRVSYDKLYLQSKIKSLLAGRIAEELIYGKNYATTGAESDLKHATELAYQMVSHWGFSQKLGLVYYDADYSFVPQEMVKEEVQALIDESYQSTQKLLRDHLPQLHVLAKALLQHETLDGDELKKVLGVKVLRH